MSYIDRGLVAPTLNDATAAGANTAKIQAALNLAGKVELIGNGVAYINANLVVNSNTDLIVRKGLALRATASTGSVLINAAAVSAWTTLYDAFGVITNGPLSIIWVGNTPAWQASTSYAGGNYVTNNGNIYWCATGGTSAGSGGPSGTGTNIADNTVRWNYVTVAISDPNSTNLYAAIHWPSHGRSVGDYIWTTPQPDGTFLNYWSGTQAANTRGGPCDSAFFGVFSVVQVNDSNYITVALFRTPTQAFSGIPMNIKVADHDITIGGGGLIDYNNPTNNIGSNDPIQSHAISLAGIHGLSVGELYCTNATSYAMMLGGVNSGYVEQFHTIGTNHHDRIKVFGPAFSLNLRNSHGIDNDDCISLHTQSSTGFDYTIVACGDILDVCVTNFSTDGLIKPCTIFAQHPLLLCDNVTIEHIGGVWNGGQVTLFGSGAAPVGVVNIRNIMSRGGGEPVVNVAGTGCSIRILNIEQCVKNAADPGSSVSSGQLVLVNASGGTVVDKLNIRGCSGLSSSFNFVQVLGGTVNNLDIDGCRVEFPNSVSGSGVVRNGGSGVIGTVNIRGSLIRGFPNYVVDDSVGMRINFDNVDVPDMTNNGLVDLQNSSTVISCRNLYAPNTNYGFRFNGASGVKVSSGGGNNIKTWFTLDAAGSITPYGFDIPLDVSHATRTNGAYCFNSNAALGTLGAAGNVTCQGTAANSWRLLGDPTKQY